jgi:hypothetical protein
MLREAWQDSYGKDKALDKDFVTPPANGSEPEIEVDHVGRVPVSIAQQIYRSISKAFGGMTRLTPAQRKQRAETAARARWKKEN